jgi:hypothetical protein
MASALAAPLAAQAVCRPSASSNEAKTLAIFSVPLAFGPATAPEILPGLWVGLEGAYLPKVNPATATPRFQVNFTNQFGTVDCTRIEVNLNRGVVFGGAIPWTWCFKGGSPSTASPARPRCLRR